MTGVSRGYGMRQKFRHCHWTRCRSWGEAVGSNRGGYADAAETVEPVVVVVCGQGVYTDGLRLEQRTVCGRVLQADAIYFESKSGRRQSAVFVAIERAASIAGLQSVGSTERVLIVYREGVDGSLAQYFPSTTFSHHLYIF